MFTVTTLADADPDRCATRSRKAQPGGGTIRFAVGGGIALESGLDVPGRTTIDGTSAPAPGITLRGARTGARGTGVLNLAESDVVLRGLRIRDGGNDDIHIAPRLGRPIANVVVSHCSITNSADGGVDITGRSDLPVTDVTLVANYLAGNGGPCPKGLCGGASLANNGATRLSYYFNLWDGNLRLDTVGGGARRRRRRALQRDPGTEQGSIQIRDGARANLVDNTLEGRRGQQAAVEMWGGRAWVDDTPSDVTRQSAIPALPVPSVPSPRPAATVIREAGALPRDAVDQALVAGEATSRENRR